MKTSRYRYLAHEEYQQAGHLSYLLLQMYPAHTHVVVPVVASPTLVLDSSCDLLLKGYEITRPLSHFLGLILSGSRELEYTCLRALQYSCAACALVTVEY